MRSISHLRYPLDRVFLVSSHIPILRALQNCREGMSGRSIASQAHINHQACAVAIRNLEGLGILQRQGSGKTQLIRFNFENYLVKNSLIPLLRQESEFLKQMRREVVDTFHKDSLAITLFGSAARGQDLPGSDMDVFILAGKSSKSAIQNKAMEYGPAFMRRYGIRLSLMVLTVSEARSRIKKLDPLLKNVLAEGIDLLPKKLRDHIL